MAGELLGEDMVVESCSYRERFSASTSMLNRPFWNSEIEVHKWAISRWLGPLGAWCGCCGSCCLTMARLGFGMSPAYGIKVGCVDTCTALAVLLRVTPRVASRWGVSRI